jgi:hypothetical protein
MKKTIRVALSFATYSDSELNNFAILVAVCLKNNSLFPDLPLTLAAFGVLQTAYQNALIAAANGGRIATAAKNEARANLIAALRQLAAYVQSVGLVNVSDVLSSGFDTVSSKNTQSPLLAPVLSGLDNSVSGQLLVKLQAVANAKAYQVQYSSGTGPWLEAGIFPNTRNIVITGLTSGTVYNVRVRAVGGSQQYSPWSTVLSLMCT